MSQKVLEKYVIYTMCNDTRLSSLAILLESNSQYDNMKIKIIPFDENIEKTKELCTIYNAEIIKTEEKWDQLGQSLYKEEEYRPNIKSWNYFRKLNVFNEENENFIFLDSNVVILNSLYPVIKLLDKQDIVFGARSLVNRNFTSWAKTLINILNPYIKDGFNAGFWCTNSNLFKSLDIKEIYLHPQIRSCLTVSPEQSFLSLMVALKNFNVSLIGDEIKNSWIMLAGETLKLESIVQKEKLFFLDNKNILTIKWTGVHYSKSNKIPKWEIVLPFVEALNEKVKENNSLESILKRDFNQLISKRLK